MTFACLREGADDHITKPLRVDKVTAVWRSVWRKRKEHKVYLMLEEERRKRKSLEMTINRLQDQVSVAVDTPLNVIARTVRSLLQAEGMSSEAK